MEIKSLQAHIYLTLDIVSKISLVTGILLKEEKIIAKDSNVLVAYIIEIVEEYIHSHLFMTDDYYETLLKELFPLLLEKFKPQGDEVTNGQELP
jgi:phage/plasmid-associated DNA primase